MYCPNCGEQLPEGARFCGACGNMLAEPVNMDTAESALAKELTASGYEEGPNAAERRAAPEVAEESSPTNATAEPEYAGEPMLTEEARAQEAEEVPTGAAQNFPGPDVPQTQFVQSAGGRSRKNNVLPVILIAAAIVVIVMVNVIMSLLPTDEDRWQEQYDLGVRYLNEADYEQAIVAFTAAIEIDANLADAYLGRAGAYAAAGTAESSEEYLTLAAADYAAVMEMYEGEEITGEIYASRGDVYYALAALVESSDEDVAGEYRSSAVSDYISAIDFGGAAEEVYVRAAEIYILQEEYYLASDVVSKGLDVYPESGELLALYNETETLIEEAEEAARLAAEQAELEAEQAALDAWAEEYLETARAYEEAGELNAAIHTLYEANHCYVQQGSDEVNLWDYFEELYEEWKRIFVPVEAIWLYDSEGELYGGTVYEYDDNKRIVVVYDYDRYGSGAENRYEYDGDDWAVAMQIRYLYDTSGEIDDRYTSEGAPNKRTLIIPEDSRAIEGNLYGEVCIVDANPYGVILNEDGLDYSVTVLIDIYMEITYDEQGLVMRIDCYRDGNFSGYALIEYGEQ